MRWSHIYFICILTVQVISFCVNSFHGLMDSINWPIPSVWGFIAQLGERCSANAEATGSNHVEAPKHLFFSLGYFVIAYKLRFTAMVTYSFQLKILQESFCLIFVTTALARSHYCQRKLFPKRKRNSRMHFGAFGANQDTKNTDARSHEQNDDSLIVPDDKRNLQPPRDEK